MDSLNIAIAGCGIAGLALASLLKAQGHSVTIYERFEEPQPIGSGLMIQPSGLCVLAALGLDQEAVKRGARIAALLGLNTEGEAVLEAAYKDLPFAGAFGLGIHRASLFFLLFEAAQSAGVEIITGFEVSEASLNDHGGAFCCASGARSARHDLLVDCLGVGSTLVAGSVGSPDKHNLPFGALWATVDWPTNGEFDASLLEQRYERAQSMVGLLPIGDGKAAFFWSLRADAYEEWKDRPLSRWWDEVCQLWPQCEILRPQITEHQQLVFARYAHRTSAPSKDARLIHIGDAWHAASPQLGQGANMALLDAYGLAKAIGAANGVEDIGERFFAMRKGHVQLYQAMTWAFTPPFQSQSIWPAIFRDHFMAPASRIAPAPAIKAQLVAGLAGKPLEKLGLELPDYSALAASP